ncbi:sigma factor [Streptomyces uncialis]|uniref:sigma factor n=1 Tax=Streptomyces uncialis TaxID=1048205 RepID=UPI0037991C82
MTHFTAEQIAAAKRNELEAVTAVIAETESLILKRATDYATRAGTTDHDLADDLAQAGRIRVWESLEKFDGESPAQFMAYIDKALHSAMSEQRRRACRPGVTDVAMKDFETALVLAGGDPYKAVRVATTKEMGPRKMSRDHAYAAFFAWRGMESLDKILGACDDGSSITLRDVIAVESGIPADLLEPSDYSATRRATVREHVHRTLGLMGEGQRRVLKSDHGISPHRDYSLDGSDAELAADMGTTTKAVQEARAKGRTRFAALYRAGARAW